MRDEELGDVQHEDGGTMRIVKVMALVIVVALVPMSVGLVMLRHLQSQQRTLDRSLASQVSEQVAANSSMANSVRSVSQMLSENPMLNLAFSDPKDWAANRSRVDSTLGFLNLVVYPQQADAAGVWAVGGRCAAAAQLKGLPCIREVAHAGIGLLSSSTLDALGKQAATLIPKTLALKPGEVYTTKPFVSPDTRNWVLLFATPLPVVSHASRGILYFELQTETFRSSLPQTAQGSGIDKLQLAVLDKAGNVIMRSDVARTSILGVPDDKRFISLAGQRNLSGLTTIDTKGGSLRVAWQHLPSGNANPNTWTIVAAAPVKGGNLITDNPILFGVVAAALLAIALFMGRRWVHTSNQAMTDVLTGLGNRRKLVTDLQKQLPGASESSPLLLALYDLDGFKNYNDSFGHPAGDALLARLGKNVQTAMRERGGDAYRMGGDEFCVVVQIGEEGQSPILADASAALSDRGEGFAVGSSYGAVLLPQEANDVAVSLRLADQRLYASKNSGRRSAGRQSADVLLQALHERSPELGDHLVDVARLTAEVGRRLGMSGVELDHLRQAAQLHDVGKMAIPDAILKKPGPLDREEWDFIRGHTVVGERIVSAAPSLAQVSKIVRSSHERFNGSGYPDGLKGEEIPLPSRIIAVCDAFDAMIGPRPYRLGMNREKASSELRRCAGAQFDPVVVDFFLSVVEELEREGDHVAATPG